MPTLVDRIQGLSGSLAVKAPVRAATTVDIALNGLQTVDGVVLADGDRVLVRAQDNATENGIYKASTSDWVRSLDFNGVGDVVHGTLVVVVSGTVLGGKMWQVRTPDPVLVGVSALVFGVTTTEGLDALGLSSGSSLVGFLQAGAGAVARTVQSKERDVISVKDFGAVGDGATDDTVAIQAALTYAHTIASTIDEGSSIIVDLSGGNYAITSGVTFANGGEGVTLQNGRLTAIGGGWSASTFMVTMGEYAARSRLLNVVVDCGKVAAGVDCKGGRPILDGCEIFHFKGHGVKWHSTVAGDGYLNQTTIYEWGSGDAEFTTEGNYVATALSINRADMEVRDCVLKWSYLPLHLGPLAATCTVVGTHLYNGGAGVLVKNRPRLIHAERGANVMFDHCYLDNGETDLYGDQVPIRFNGCRALYSTAACTLTYFIGLHCTDGDGTPSESILGPWRFSAVDWDMVSISLWSSTIPFYKYVSDDDTWSGSRTSIEAAVGNKWMLEDLHLSKCQNDSDAVLTLHTPATGGVGARLKLVDSDTTSAAYVASSGDHAYLSKGTLPVGTSVTANKTYAANEGDGQLIGVNNGATAITITIPNNGKVGAERLFYLGSTGKVTFTVASGGTINTPYGVQTTVVVDERQYSVVRLSCVGGGVGTAVYSLVVVGYQLRAPVVSGTTDVILEKGQYDQGLYVNNNGATPTYMRLPATNTVGWKCTFISTGTGNGSITMASGATQRGLTGAITMTRYVPVTMTCYGNSDGNSAAYTYENF